MNELRITVVRTSGCLYQNHLLMVYIEEIFLEKINETTRKTYLQN